MVSTDEERLGRKKVKTKFLTCEGTKPSYDMETKTAVKKVSVIKKKVKLLRKMQRSQRNVLLNQA